MAKKLTGWKTKGMNKDLSVSAFNPEFAFDNMNMRLTTNEGNTMLSWVNEKGTADIEVEGISENISITYISANPESNAYALPKIDGEQILEGRVVGEEANVTVDITPAGLCDNFEYNDAADVCFVFYAGDIRLSDNTLLFSDFCEEIFGNIAEYEPDAYVNKYYAGFNLSGKVADYLDSLAEERQPTGIQYTWGLREGGTSHTHADCIGKSMIYRFFVGIQYEREHIWLSTIKAVRVKETFPSTPESITLSGIPVGKAVFNDKLILFTTTNQNVGGSGQDYIYLLEHKESQEVEKMNCRILYSGKLNFCTKNPLETLVSYESENIQKVYWTDYRNQPRLININMPAVQYADTDIDTRFDFIRELQLDETVTIEKLVGVSGTFASGVIQYAFTYYTKYGQETNIFYTSQLLYVSPLDRGAAPDEKVSNAFRIKVKNVDKNFDYLRIYSIQRTSVDGTPICKRIQDIEISSLQGTVGSDIKTAIYIDNGTAGESIDPNELLYKGGEEVVAKTMEQKDDTLFFGNIKRKRPNIESTLKESIATTLKEGVSLRQRTVSTSQPVSGAYKYFNQLTVSDGEQTVPCSGFKAGETYRLGVQFQHKSGRWSDPIWIDDKMQTYYPFNDNSTYNTVTLRGFKGTLPAPTTPTSLVTNLINAGYVKVRGVAVFPDSPDRNVLCQGVVNPTLYTINHRNQNNATYYPDGVGDLQAQSSWFFRPYSVQSVYTDTIQPLSDNNGLTADGGSLNYIDYMWQHATDYVQGYDPSPIKSVEIQGGFDDNDKFKIDKTDFITLHSPDVEFDTQLLNTDFNAAKYKQVGFVQVTNTFSDIDIQTDTPTASKLGGGFVHKTFVTDNAQGIVSGLFYDDFFLDDDNDTTIRPAGGSMEASAVKWMVYLWNKGGSLNNDIDRSVNNGTITALLKKKIISNFRYATTVYNGNNASGIDPAVSPQLFNSEENTIIKLGNDIYRGNIDTLLMPTHEDGMYFACGTYADDANAYAFKKADINTPFSALIRFKTAKSPTTGKGGLYVNNYGGTIDHWYYTDTTVGDKWIDLAEKKESVRMKYKSTPHVVIKCNSTTQGITWTDSESHPLLPIVELRQTPVLPYGGTSPDALRENVWIPCGFPVKLKKSGATEFYWEWGDTYYQRWDCLKTYPYTPEDINQVVEIGSFMLETRVNIDGRYDRNRGQVSNLYMTPQNFNLLNYVYSQKDNFFSYKIQDNAYYENTDFLTSVVWSKTKTPGSDTDTWANVTLASSLEMDGDKGEVNKLTRFNNQLLCFQDTGLSQILYNENAQIATAQGVPIEIANSGKVDGKRYISSEIGCSNKWSVCSTPGGLYFIDNTDKSFYLFNGQLTNLSSASMNAWAKQNILSTKTEWTPDAFDDFVTYYDKLNQDILFISKDTCLAYSEKLGAFTSFYNYEHAPYFCNLENAGIWATIAEENGALTTKLWKHQSGEYCHFFGQNKPYWTILVGNPEPQADKIFTNMEFRASVEGDGVLQNEKFIPTPPFDGIEVWDEYQHGFSALEYKSGHSAMVHGGDSSSLKRKFRIWRCDIPRNNCLLDSEPRQGNEQYSTDADLGISRYIKKPLDRMRNMWLYLKLKKNVAGPGTYLHKVEVHDMVMTYYS